MGPFRLFVGAAIFFGGYGLVTQVILPLWYDLETWPAFRGEGALWQRLRKARQEKREKEIEEQINKER